MPHGTGGVFVPVELHPEVAQGVRRFIVIGDRLGAGEMILFLIEADLDIVVGALLPVLWAGSA